MSQVPSVLNPREDDIQKMLAAEVHLGTQNLDPKMHPYLWKRRQDGFHLIDLGKTWDKLVLAARVIASIENPADVCVISARTWGQRAVLKFANFTGAVAISGRFTPGTFTNQQQQKDYKEPRLLLVTDTRLDAQPLTEASYVNIPTIAFANTDSPLKHVDIAIPANNTGKHSIGLLYWLLAREVLHLRGTLPRDEPWSVMPDLFFYRDPDEAEKSEEAELETVGAYDEFASKPPSAFEQHPVPETTPTEPWPLTEQGAFPPTTGPSEAWGDDEADTHPQQDTPTWDL